MKPGAEGTCGAQGVEELATVMVPRGLRQDAAADDDRLVGAWSTS